MSVDKELDELITRLVAATNKDEKLSIYNIWAARYDDDLNRKGYVAPGTTVNLLTKYIDAPDALIYDAGCGTGKVGEQLSASGYTNLAGADFSEDMLSVAKQSGYYKTLHHADYTNQIAHESDSFDAVISVGVYSPEFEGVFLKELARIVKPGGVICLSCRPVHYEPYAEADIKRLVSTGVVSETYKQLGTYMSEGAAQAWYIVLTVQ